MEAFLKSKTKKKTMQYASYLQIYNSMREMLCLGKKGEHAPLKGGPGQTRTEWVYNTL